MGRNSELLVLVGPQRDCISSVGDRMFSVGARVWPCGLMKDF